MNEYQSLHYQPNQRWKITCRYYKVGVNVCRYVNLHGVIGMELGEIMFMFCDSFYKISRQYCKNRIFYKTINFRKNQMQFISYLKNSKLIQDSIFYYVSYSLLSILFFLSNVQGRSESCIFGLGIYHRSFGCWVLTNYIYTFWLVGILYEQNNSFISQVLHYSTIYKGYLDCIMVQHNKPYSGKPCVCGSTCSS